MDFKSQAESAIGALRDQVDGLERQLRRTLGQLSKYQAINTAEAIEFLKEPWCILPKSREEWWVVVPRWVGLQVGWLERSTETFNIFTVNRYSHWLGGIPTELREKLELPEPVKATVIDGHLRSDAKVADKVRAHLRGEDKDGFRVIRGHEFELMAELIEMGSLPFAPNPVHENDLRLWKFEGPPAALRDYQVAGWNAFLKYGAVGIYWPFGQGKTVIGTHACGRIIGPKLVVAPTRTLIDQWDERIRKWGGHALRNEVEIITYQSWERVKDRDWKLVVFDEAHRLPANTFSRLASIRAKYRIGLSASPYREDGRTRYIFALTGYPVGVDWTDFLRKGLIRKPDVEVRIVSGWNEKARITELEVKETKGQTIIFCDSIDQGRSLSNRLDVPHVYGDTKNRLEILKKATAAVVSRVGDEGLSLPNLRKIVEVDFHGASRRQESQRMGRLLHADGPGEHIVLMTRDEYDRCEGRFLALEEKGINVVVKE